MTATRLAGYTEEEIEQGGGGGGGGFDGVDVNDLYANLFGMNGGFPGGFPGRPSHSHY